MDILDPSLALQSLGYSVKVQESLGQYSTNGELFEVAGILDNSNTQVMISRRFSPVIRNFTTAHELGHAGLHDGSGLHRDRALDGSPNNHLRDGKEIEADVFAAYFLLPEKRVRSVFQKIFLTQSFILNEDTAFALTSKDLGSLQDRCRTLRDLTRILASAEYYNGVHVISLANHFRVSTEAMAIRLEELVLVTI
jgi:Zn-dependent peptidase ImmA (M78 family)